MNKFYIIVPLVLLGVFIFFYRGALDDMARRDAEKARLAQIEKEKDDARRKEIEERAAADARKRQEEREAVERAKEEKKQREYNEGMRALTEEAERYIAEADRNAKEAADLEIQLGELRNQRDRVNREVFELAKQVELAKIDRRNAELEIQRMVDMVAQRVGASSLAAAQPPAPAQPTRK
jgi:chromosome segregation ATPase